jgi:hypothetical protein
MDRKKVAFHVVEQPLQHTLPPTYTWHPSFFRRAPWLGISALIAAIGCAIASAIIIIISDQHPADWRFEPSVVLALLSAIATAFLFVVLHSGVTITWWRAVSNPRGTSLATLHHIWNHGGGGGLSAAFFAGRNVNKVAIASILICVASVTYSPLLQRASHTRSMALSTNVTKSIELAQTWRDELGGINGDDRNIVLNLPFLEAIQDWYSSPTMLTRNLSDYACNGTCKGYVQTIGIMGHECTETHQELDFQYAADHDELIFAVNFTSYDDNDDVPTLELSVRRPDEVDSSCTGTYVTNTCKIHVGLVGYPIILKGRNISFDTDPDYLGLSEPISFNGDLSTAAAGSPTGPLGGLSWFSEAYFRANATIGFDRSSNVYTVSTVGTMAHQYLDTRVLEDRPALCNFFWTDPTRDMITAFNDVLFRVNYYQSHSESVQEFPATQLRPTLIYESNFLYLEIGSALLFLAVLAVSTTLWGWWELGRHVSLSPLETGKALGLLHFPENSVVPPDADTLVDVVGDTQVRYGETTVLGVDGTEKSALGIRPLGVGMDPAAPRRARMEYV